VKIKTPIEQAKTQAKSKKNEEKEALNMQHVPVKHKSTFFFFFSLLFSHFLSLSVCSLSVFLPLFVCAFFFSVSVSLSPPVSLFSFSFSYETKMREFSSFSVY
jgi:Na+/glutamate symporter